MANKHPSPHPENLQRQGRPKGSPNKVTKEARDLFLQFVKNRSQVELKWMWEKAKKKDPANAMKLLLGLMEYYVPKLARNENINENTGPVVVQVVEHNRSKNDVSQRDDDDSRPPGQGGNKSK